MLSFWSNLVGYQLTWFAAVIGAGHGHAWPGVLCALVFIAWQLARSPWRRTDVGLLIAALLLGCAIDGAGAQWAVMHHATPTPGLFGAPAWILALWLSFAMTINHSLRYLRGRPLVAAAFGAIGAPLAYAGAARGWQAVSFAAPAWHAMAWLAAGWAVAMLVLTRLAVSRQENAT